MPESEPTLTLTSRTGAELFLFDLAWRLGFPILSQLHRERVGYRAKLDRGRSDILTPASKNQLTGNRSVPSFRASSLLACPFALALLAGCGPALVTAPIPILLPAISITVTSLNFPDTALGSTSATQSITLANTGTAPLNVTTIYLSGASPAEFSAKNNCLAPLAPLVTCVISVAFVPSATGSQAATVSINTNVTGTPAGIALSGNGIIAANALIPGANANLAFQENTGTTAYDSSGNNNNCILASGLNAPYWSKGGLQLNDDSDSNPKFCSLPASSSNADASTMNSRTLTLCAYLNPITGTNGDGFDYVPAFGGSTRADIAALWLSGAGTVRGAYYMGDYFGYGGIPTYTTQPLVGYHCITYALGSTADNTLDHFYIDATEVSPYGAQGTLWDKRLPGDAYTIGAMPWDPAAFLWGTVYYVLAYPTQLTAASIAHNFPVLQQKAFYSRGVGALPTASVSNANVIVTNGDSITNESPGSVTPYPQLLTLNRAFSIYDTAVAGKLLFTTVADSPLTDLPLYSANSPYAFASNAAGINDIDIDGRTPAQIVADRSAIYASYRKTGFTPIVTTMLSSFARDPQIEAINDALRTLASASGYVLLDWANEPCLGAAGAYANPGQCTGFQADGLHASQAGEHEMALLYSNVVNYLTGATQSAPTRVTAASYILQPADRFLSIQGTAAQAISLPSCYGWSATTPFALTNGNLTGPVTLVPTATFTLNGTTNPFAVPPGTSIQIYANLVSPSTSGCAWFTK